MGNKHNLEKPAQRLAFENPLDCDQGHHRRPDGRNGVSKTRMAEMMETSRAQVDRLLDPKNSSATLETLMRAAKVVGRELRLELE
ncbi:MAG: hypothetical protein WAK01_04675 [Methylocystis sp.]